MTFFEWSDRGRAIVFLFVFINLVVDILYSILDPRVRLQDVKS